MSEAAPDRAQAARTHDPRVRLGLHLASRIRVGKLSLELPDGQVVQIARTAEPDARIVVRDARAFTRLLRGGNVGLAEAYLNGWWDSPSIRHVMALAAANERELWPLLHGSVWTRLLLRLAHSVRPNSRRGARRNIVEHYDIGNEFYALWLDPSMTYSSALFSDPSEPLEQAQARKMRRLCEAMSIAPGMRVLEIGCGWGGFAELAAREFGVSVLGITLSPSQLEFARARIAAAGLGDRVELRLQDYRDVGGEFDRIASIEMFEAVGMKYWPTFFSTLRARLAPGGLAGLQTIAISDALFDDYRQNPDFIQRHVFPGGMLASPARLRSEVARAGLQWTGEHWFGAHYAETLARWQAGFEAAWPSVARLRGLGEARFKRLWEYYLAYCETGFRAGWTDVGQIVLARPR